MLLQKAWLNTREEFEEVSNPLQEVMTRARESWEHCLRWLGHEEDENRTRYVVEPERNDFLYELLLNSLNALLARGDTVFL